ncbi:sterol esterase, partial [Mycena floridula]
VTLPYGTYQGGTTGNITQFLGIQFAQPPVNGLRLRKPIAPLPVKGVQPAIQAGPACPQQTIATLPFIKQAYSFGSDAIYSEDCLTVNVWRPTAVSSKPLPVMIWLFGGGFAVGGNADQSPLVLLERSIAIGEPIIFVAPNYRLSGLGWLGGKEVKEAGIGNLGLHDQRFAFKWVQENIAAFGGDPGRVIMYVSGLSAGAISTAFHLLINDGHTEGLFHGAFMTDTDDIQDIRCTPAIDSPRLQEAFDAIVRGTNCTGSKDSIECLRKVPFETLWPVINGTSTDFFSFSGNDFVWRPTVDGDTLKSGALCTVAQGRFANIPIISGNSDDEGTIFALPSLNVTTDAEFLVYEKTFVLPGATSAQIQDVAKAYPSDPSLGSPFNTGDNNTLTPEFKRMSAIFGDVAFQGPRRHLVQASSPRQKTWSWLNKRGKSTPNLGAFHSSDVGGIWFNADKDNLFGIDALIHFVNTLDPNGIGKVIWPQRGSSANILNFSDPLDVSVTSDTYREDEMKLLLDIQLGIEQQQGLCN